MLPENRHADSPEADPNTNGHRDRPRSTRRRSKPHVNGESRNPPEANGHQADQADQAEARRLDIVTASRLDTLKPQWLWEGRLRLGTVAILQGDTGVGKSTLVRALAADITGGRPLTRKAKRKKPLGSVLLFSGEEQLEVTVKPGLVAAGANLDFVHCGDVWRGDGSGRLALPYDHEVLEEAIRRHGAVMVALDPLFNFADDATDLDGPTLPARRFMAALAGVADRTGCFILLVRNLTKDRSKGALASGRGSAELGNAARAVLHLDKVAGRPDVFGLAVAKVNDAPLPLTLTYTLEAGKGGVRIALQGQEELSADDLAGGEDEALERSQLEKAVALLRHVLKDGEVESKVVKQKAADACIAERTLLKAAKLLGVVHRRAGSRAETQTFWKLPRQHV